MFSLHACDVCAAVDVRIARGVGERTCGLLGGTSRKCHHACREIDCMHGAMRLLGSGWDSTDAFTRCRPRPGFEVRCCCAALVTLGD